MTRLVTRILPWAALAIAARYGWRHDNWRLAGLLFCAALLFLLRSDLSGKPRAHRRRTKVAQKWTKIDEAATAAYEGAHVFTPATPAAPAAAASSQAWGELPSRRLVAIPAEELVEPIHLSVGPHRMACGAEEGVGVLDRDRVTCPACRHRHETA